MTTMELRRWPRKNDPESIRARQQTVRDLTSDGEVLWDDLEPWTQANEALTGVSVVPVSVIGPLTVSLGDYGLREPDGVVEERGRETETVYVPLAHTEGGLSASLYRGARAVTESGGFRTYVLADRITRASCFICKSVGDAVELARWVEAELPSLREWLESARGSIALEVGEVARGPHPRRRPDVSCALALDDRRRSWREHDDAQLVPAEHGLRARALAGSDRALDARGEHGRRQEALVPVLPGGSRQDGDRRGDAHRRRGAARAAHDDRRPARARLGRDARGGRVRDAVGRVHARLRDRGDLRRNRPGPRDDRDELDGARRRPSRRGRPERLDPAPRPGGRDGRRRHDASVRALVARADGLRRRREGLPLRADRRCGDARARDQRVGRNGHGRLRELLPRAPRARWLR